MSKIFISVEKKKEICEKYIRENWTIKLLSEKFSVSRHIIKNILLENNIPIKQHTKRSGLFLKEDYFEEINTEAKAYFLGLLFTDGNIYIGNKKTNQITLELTIRDKEILDIFKKELNTDNKISYRKNIERAETVSVRVFSEKMVKDLSKYYIIPQKTKRVNHLPIGLIPVEFQKDFIRGLIDGDGSIYFFGDKKQYIGLTFCSYSYNICQELQECCNKLINTKNKHKIFTEKNKHISRMCYTKQDITEQLVTVLYKDSNYYLTRKYNLAKVVFESKNEEDIV